MMVQSGRFTGVIRSRPEQSGPELCPCEPGKSAIVHGVCSRTKNKGGGFRYEYPFETFVASKWPAIKPLIPETV
jgi:hypothetical protein